MIRFRPVYLTLLALLALPACGALKDAFTAHSDIVARAGNQELTVDQLAALMANSEVPLRPDVARTIAQIWVNYQLLAQAGAAGDTLGTNADADAGMWSSIAQLRTRKLYDQISVAFPQPDPSQYEQKYNEGELLAASHILLSKQPEGFGPTQNDSIRREAERLARTVNAGNFARVAQQRSQDPGSRERGGNYGVFPRGQMVPEFDQGILSVPPGGITGVVETQFGYHIIRRSTWAEAREQFSEAYPAMLTQKAESVYVTRLEEAANVQVRSAAPKVVKAIAEDIDSYRDDRTVLATSRRGNLSAGRMAQWIAAFPPQSQMRPQIMEAPDSLLPRLVENIMRSELLLKQADSANIQLDSADLAGIRSSFFGGVTGVMRQLELAPEQLAGAGEDRAAREKAGAEKVNAYLTGLLNNQGQYVEVPEQLAVVLREKFESRVVTAGLDRALAEATRLRATPDSTSAAAPAAPATPAPAPNP
jgi:parvulin-like peptidyl-prolyl isomerase